MKKTTDTKKLFSNLSAFGHQNKFKSCFLSCCLTENEKEFLLKYVKKWGKKYDSTQFTFVCDCKQETMPSKSLLKLLEGYDPFISYGPIHRAHLPPYRKYKAPQQKRQLREKGAS